MLPTYSPFWIAGGALTLPLWAAKDAQIAEAPSAAPTAHRDTFAAALVADVLGQARDDAKGKGAEAGAAVGFLSDLRGALATFAPCGPPSPRPAWPAWCGPYLAALWAGESATQAARLAGVAYPTVLAYATRTPDFAEARNGLIEARREPPPTAQAEGATRRNAA